MDTDDGLQTLLKGSKVKLAIGRHDLQVLASLKSSIEPAVTCKNRLIHVGYVYKNDDLLLFLFGNIMLSCNNESLSALSNFSSSFVDMV